MNIVKSFSLGITLLGLSSCGSNGQSVEVQKSNGFQQSHGPFDSNGNYVERWADASPKRKYVSQKSSSKKQVTATAPKKTTPEVAKNTYTPKKTASTTAPKKTYTAPKKTYTTPKKKTTKKTTAKKITPKTKPPIIHKVVRGDTLYGLSRKYSTSVVTIQKVNSLKGTSITLGRKLIIPRK